MAAATRATGEYRFTRNVDIAMRDGVLLRADVHRAGTAGRQPTVLVRSPYGSPSFRMIPVQPLLDAGFAVVLQHCRGRGDSDGRFTPWVDEPADGADTVAWIRAQDWSDGQVVGWGVSYVAGTALQTATADPEGYVAAVAMQTPFDFYADVNYWGGVFCLGGAQAWALIGVLMSAQHDLEAGVDAQGALDETLAALADNARTQLQLPIRETANLPAHFPAYADWLDHSTRDDYWRSLGAPANHVEQMDLPAYHVAGWSDLFLRGTIANYVELSGRAPTAAARERQVLVIGPWNHGLWSVTGVGELDYGPQSTAESIGMEGDQIRFLAEACGIAEAAERPRVRIFVMGDNVWREEQEWPLARAEQTALYLQPGGGLATDPAPADAASATYTFDPHDPVPTAGGGLLLPTFNSSGPHDQRGVEARADVLSYTTAVLENDLEVTGHVSLLLHATTSAVSTDWTAKLVDVYPDGRALNVCDGIARAEPGATVHEIDLGPTSQVFKAGHALRVDVASSNFPRFARNPGNGADPARCTEADFVEQHQTVHHDDARRSCLRLPVIPSS